MGTKVAPSLANIFMGEFEDKFIHPKSENSICWFRFIDNIVGIYRGSEESLKTLVDEFNEAHLTIKFTLECSKYSVNFLDTTVHLEEGKLWTDLYCTN